MANLLQMLAYKSSDVMEKETDGVGNGGKYQENNESENKHAKGRL